MSKFLHAVLHSSRKSPLLVVVVVFIPVFSRTFSLFFPRAGVADRAAGRTQAGWSGLHREAMRVGRRKVLISTPAAALLSSLLQTPG